MAATPCVLASQFAAQSALANLASALDNSATRIIAEKDRQEALLAGLPCLPAESVDGQLASVLGIDAVRLAMVEARNALTSHIDGLSLLLGETVAQREQISRMAGIVAPAVSETPPAAPEPPAPPADPVPVAPTVEEEKPVLRPFTLDGLDRDTVERMARTKWSGSLAKNWCINHGLDYPGLQPFGAALIEATGPAITCPACEQEFTGAPMEGVCPKCHRLGVCVPQDREPAQIAANAPSSPAPTADLFPADATKAVEQVLDAATKDADANGDQLRPRGRRRQSR